MYDSQLINIQLIGMKILTMQGIVFYFLRAKCLDTPVYSSRTRNSQ
jgi:hypothetical protein